MVGRSHREGLTLKEMEEYLKHHLKIAEVHEQLSAEKTIRSVEVQEACFEEGTTSPEGNRNGETQYDESSVKDLFYCLPPFSAPFIF